MHAFRTLSFVAVVWLSTAALHAQPATGDEIVGESPQARIERLIELADRAYGEGRFEASAGHYEAAVEWGAEDVNVPFNAACAAALGGQMGRAFHNLEVALDLGYADANHLASDTDLHSLRDDPRWAGVLERTEDAAEAFRKRWNSPALATPFQDNLSDTEKVAGLSKLWSEVAFNFVNFHLVPDLDWDALYVETLPLTLATGSTLEYYRVLERFIAQVHDGHTNVYVPKELNTELYARPALRTRLIEGAVIVVEVFDETLRGEGIEPGMELVAIDGVPVFEYAEVHVRPYMCASTSQDLDTRTFEYDLLRGSVSQPVTLSVRHGDGTSIERTVRRLTWEQRSALRTSRAPFTMTPLEDGVLHIELNSFGTNEAAEAFANAFDAIAAASGLVLDLRNNGGGNSGVGWNILRHLTDTPVPTTKWHTLQYRPTHRAWGRPPQTRFGSDNGLYDAAVAGQYDRPVVMLIGPRTFSAAEDMAASFDMLGRGALIGEPSGGSTGQPLSVTLPGGGSARVCTKHDTYADGTAFVGTGIQPDIAVAQSIADFRAGVDTALDAAVAHLRGVPAR